jgi:tagatose 6-phosphate kinase
VIVVGGFNTALDKFAETDTIEPGAVLRLRNVRTLPGGKGLHVALACATLGEPVTLVGLMDDANRPLFEAMLTRAAVRFVGVTVNEPIRTCMAIRDATGRTTELLEPGPDVSGPVAAALMDAFRREASDARIAVLSGSLPPSLPVDSYGALIRAVGGDRVLLDSSGAALETGVAAGPLLVKPNRSEAEQLAGVSITSITDAANAAAAIAARGPRCVVVSLGVEGAVVWSSHRVFHVAPPVTVARNPVGAGDCLLAGFAIGLSHEWPIERCARYAVACGTAKVMHSDTGLLRREDVNAVVSAVSVREVTIG